MARSSGRRWAYAAAAAAALAATLLFLGTRNYVCSSAESGVGSACGELTAADLIAHAIIAAIGIGFGAYFIVKAVRATPRR